MFRTRLLSTTLLLAGAALSANLHAGQPAKGKQSVSFKQEDAVYSCGAAICLGGATGSSEYLSGADKCQGDGRPMVAPFFRLKVTDSGGRFLPNESAKLRRQYLDLCPFAISASVKDRIIRTFGTSEKMDDRIFATGGVLYQPLSNEDMKQPTREQQQALEALGKQTEVRLRREGANAQQVRKEQERLIQEAKKPRR